MQSSVNDIYSGNKKNNYKKTENHLTILDLLFDV